ncbi:MAG: 30S ribosomal protein S19 [Candidatus Nanoarchaeia archaeon]
MAEETYRGRTLEELKKMNAREFASLVKSRARRTILRNHNVIENIIKEWKIRQEKGKAIKTHKRDLVIIPEMVDMTIHIHNGKQFMPVKITQKMLGHRLGEFAKTRKEVKHGAAGVGATKSSAALSVK